MHSDRYDDPFFEEEADLAYDDGFAEALDLGEADEISRSKRREKTRREALRKDTGRVVTKARRSQNTGDRRHRVRADAARLAALQWDRRYKELIFRFWNPKVRDALDAALLAIMRRAVIYRAVKIAGEKMGDANSVEDVVAVGARSLVSSAVAEAVKRSRISAAEGEVLTQRVYDALDTGEKVIRVVVAIVSREADGIGDMFDDLESLDFDAEDELAWEDFADGEVPPRRARAARPADDRRLAAEALRKTAKYLLRIERRLLDAGR
jgi:hypothetical protein